MGKYITIIIAFLGAAFTWFFKGMIAERKVEKLKEELNEALSSSKQHEINAKAKNIEAEGLREQQLKEDERRDKNADDIAAELDNRFK